MKLAGVVVLYNPDQKVINNINSYIDELDALYLVDNSSADNSTLFMHEKVEYIPLRKNTGIAHALNVGAKKAIDHNFHYLLTMDQDSMFEKDALKNMKSIIDADDEKDQVGIYSPFHKTAISEPVPEELFTSPLVVMTSGNIINLDIYKCVEGFEEWMFIDCVDFEYGLNVRKHGYTIKQINTVFLDHELGDYEIKYVFNKKIFCDNHSALRRYYIVRNSFYLYDMYHDDYPDYCQAVVKQAKQSFFYATVFEKHGFKKLIYMIRGYIDYRKGKKGAYGK
ncbi:glycosyltransferase family 2 protein [Holdemanella biformis]|uniref:glycosyltransferase family 2 protein n=1 Tax=Holdemanella biformis TaxID=1735 RepID=UPI0022E27E0A|nr:glycosyltransferase family 2 protein [Holdemanella biformis]